MSRSSYPDAAALRTSSAIRAWWLRTMHGYRVVDVRRHPKRGWYGRMRIKLIYKLLPGDRL